MFLIQIGAAIALAPPTTGVGDANAGLLAAMWAGSVLWSATAVLLLVRHADLPDIATASMLVTIAAFAAFTLTAAFDARGTKAEVNLVDGLFLGVTAGALTAMLVWGIALGTARILKLPVSPTDESRE
ncbi:MAG TPA: hypothetical protein VIH21_04245 [Dehalococcoidia bacterium]